RPCANSHSAVCRVFPDARRMCEAEQIRLTEERTLAGDFCPTANPRKSAFYSGYFSDKKIELNDTYGTAAEPITDLYENLDLIVHNNKNVWLQWLYNAIVCYEKNLPEGCVQSVASSYGPMDVAEALRGSALFYDFYERPDDLKLLLDRCVDFLAIHYEHCRSLIRHVDGGFFSWQGFWIPDNCCSITDDAAANYSPAFFREFSAPAIQKLVSRLGGLFEIHLEGSAIHILDEVLEIKGLIILQYTNNPKWPRGIEMIDRLKAKLGNIPAKILLTTSEFRSAIAQRLLPGNWIYDIGCDAEHLNEYVRDAEESMELLALAQAYTPPC
ncbi:MAG: hypothetical protein L6437_06535, partial [Kiritimatiellae bacterium]|nr:hypothetical protein [Verrucomicrobiota bacterium]MCG2659882.1 hypothetical protein [Kiritimatiellia bacterium]